MRESSAPVAAVPELRLIEIGDAGRRLAAEVRRAGFSPEVVLYIERGARLIAHAVCAELGCGAVAVSAQRRGHTLKQVLAPVVALLPRSWRDRLRGLDQRWMWSKAGKVPRLIESEFCGSLARRRVLIVDDATDSGRTIRGCFNWLAERGVAEGDVRVAVLAATTEAGRAAAHFWLFDRNTRFPWSSDSEELSQAELLYEQQRPPPYAPGDF